MRQYKKILPFTPCGVRGYCGKTCGKSYEEVMKCEYMRNPVKIASENSAKEEVKIRPKTAIKPKSKIEVKEVYKTRKEAREKIAAQKMALMQTENPNISLNSSYAYFVANEPVVYGIVRREIERQDKEELISLRHWKNERIIDIADIVQEIATKLPKKLKQNQEKRILIKLANNAVRNALRNMSKTTKNALDIAALVAEENEGEDAIIIGDIYAKNLQYEFIVDDTVEKVEAFLKTLSTEQRTIVTLLMIGYTQTDVAKKLEKGLDAISKEINEIRIKALQFFLAP